jgi:hypothetical protein
VTMRAERFEHTAARLAALRRWVDEDDARELERRADVLEEAESFARDGVYFRRRLLLAEGLTVPDVDDDALADELELRGRVDRHVAALRAEAARVRGGDAA